MKNTFILSLTALLLSNCSSSGLLVALQNDLEQERTELITIERSQVSKYLDSTLPLQVIDTRTDEILPIQFLDLDQNQSWEALLIQIEMGASEACQIRLENTDKELAQSDSKVSGRFVPERKDDFAWENDRIAFRMYGPALEATGEISSGVDVWVKSVEYPIIDKWYASGKYHKDHGEGADLFKVGPTLGCGGLGLLVEDTLYTSRNFTDYRILAQGPLRFVFELDYEVWGPDSFRVEETKRISLDAGQHFNHMSSQLKFSQAMPESVKMVTGLLAHPTLSPNSVSLDSSDDYMALYEGFKGENGSLGTAIIRESLSQKEALKKYGDQYLMVLPIHADGMVNYHAGAAWSKSPWIATEIEWQNHVLDYEVKLKYPIQITITKN